MHRILSLTVAESKRLIAKGIAQWDVVQNALANGIIAIGSGTTNGYIIEELTGEPFDKRTLVTGRTLPANYDGPKITYDGGDLVLRKGERLNVSARDILEEMRPGDVYMKGANALNYERGQAGILIGHPTGGNVGAFIGSCMARRIRFVHPVGLEKSVGVDLEEAAAMVNEDPQGKGPTLWVVPGDIFTEIEALDVLTGVQAVPVGAGGIGGAEGAVWLALFGTESELAAAHDLIESIRNEPPFA
jgi:hypothetical protein